MVPALCQKPLNPHHGQKVSCCFREEPVVAQRWGDEHAQVSLGIWCACSYIVLCVYVYICMYICVLHMCVNCVCVHMCVHVCVHVCVCVKQLDYTTDEHIVAEICIKDQLMK